MHCTFVSTFSVSFPCLLANPFLSVAGQLRGQYFPSFVYVAKDWSEQNWVYFNNSMSISLTVFGMGAGILQRWTHRYRTLQICGLVVKIIGMAVLIRRNEATSDTASIIASQILIGGGGAFSVVGSRVASQASVPHQDLALVVALLSLWTKVGSSIGAAIAALIWTDYAPKFLRQNLPSDTTDEDINKYYKDIKLLRNLPWESPIRIGAIKAYKQTLWYLLIPAILLSFVTLGTAFLQSNFYLGKQQNAVMAVTADGSRIREQEEEEIIDTSRASFKARFLKFWSGK